MESEKIFQDSYNYLDQLCRENMTDKVTIDYSQMDNVSKGQLKDIIQNFAIRRKHELGRVFLKAD